MFPREREEQRHFERVRASPVASRRFYRQIPRKQDVGDGDGDPLVEGVGVPVELVAGDPLEVPPLGVADPLPLGAEPLLGWPEGLADCFLPPGVAFGLVAADVATVLGAAVPPPGPDG
jgi:hypothetical protein